MLSGDSGMKDLIWQKIQELFANLPDQDEAQEEKKEGEPALAIEIEPKDKATL